jgi:hypothetical protein
MGITERSILLRMSFLDMTRAQLSEFSGIREQLLIPFLRGTKGLPGADIERVIRTLSDCETLVDKFRPAPISFSDTRKIGFLLQQLRDSNLDDFPTSRAQELTSEMETVLGRACIAH